MIVVGALMNGTRILNDNGHKGISFTKVVFGVTVRYLSMPEKLEIISKTPIDIDIQVFICHFLLTKRQQKKQYVRSYLL